MTTKNAKATFFAILIVVMILPLGSTNIAVSQEAELPGSSDEDATVTDEKAFQRFADDKDKYKKELKDKNKTAAEKAEIRKDIKRINLMEKILIAQANGDMERISKLTEKLESTYSAKQTQEATPLQNATKPSQQPLEKFNVPHVATQTHGAHEYPITKVSTSISGWSTTAKEFNCDIQFYSWGYSLGVTKSDAKKTKVLFTHDYPHDLGPAGYPCNVKDHYSSNFNLYTYGGGKAAWCIYSSFLDGRVTVGIECKSTKGQFGIVTTDALYGTSRSNTSEFLAIRPILL